MIVPEGWAAFEKSDQRQYTLHKMTEGINGPKSACSRANMLAISTRREVPNNSTACRGCSEIDRRESARATTEAGSSNSAGQDQGAGPDGAAAPGSSRVPAEA